MKYQLLIILLLGLLLVPAGTWAGATDISGAWTCSVNLEGGPQNVPLTFVFKQEGENLTGTVSSKSGEYKFTGTVRGNKVVFSVEIKNRSGELFKYTYIGTIESPTKMTGTAEYPKGSGKWTATKN